MRIAFTIWKWVSIWLICLDWISEIYPSLCYLILNLRNVLKNWDLYLEVLLKEIKNPFVYWLAWSENKNIIDINSKDHFISYKVVDADTHFKYDEVVTLSNTI